MAKENEGKHEHLRARTHAVRQDLGRTRRPHRRGRHRHPLHRPPPGARSHQPAGLRRPAPGRPQGLARQLDRGHRRPQHADHRLGTAATTASPTRSASEQVTTLDANIQEFGAAAYFPFLSKRQGIVHVIGPESGATLPGMTVVCGDSHTSTHGAFGALAHGIGTSEVEHVLATQTLLAKKAKNMLVRVEGTLPRGVHRQGHRAGHHRQDRHRRRHRLHHRVRRLGHPRAEHGRPHDGLQHGHRSRRARRPGGGGREDHRLRQGPPAGPRHTTPPPKRLPPWNGTRRWPTGRRCTPTPTPTSTPWSNSMPRRSCRRSPGAPRPKWCWASTAACPTPTRKRTPTSAAPSNAR